MQTWIWSKNSRWVSIMYLSQLFRPGFKTCDFSSVGQDFRAFAINKFKAKVGISGHFDSSLFGLVSESYKNIRNIKNWKSGNLNKCLFRNGINSICVCPVVYINSSIRSYIFDNNEKHILFIYRPLSRNWVCFCQNMKIRQFNLQTAYF